MSESWRNEPPAGAIPQTPPQTPRERVSSAVRDQPALDHPDVRWSGPGLLLRILALATLYALLTTLTLDLLVARFFGDPPFPLLWPATGLGFALLAVGGRRLWPVIALGTLLHAILLGYPLDGLPLAVGNTLEALVALWLVRLGRGVGLRFETQRDLWGFLLRACLIPPLFSALFGSLSMATISGMITWSELPGNVLRWWLCNATGMLVLAPPALTWFYPPRPPWRLEREPLVAIVLGTSAAFATFGGAFDHTVLDPISPFLPLPFIFAVSLRQGPREASTLSMIFALVASWGTARGTGPFGEAVALVSSSALWPYLTTLLLITLTTSVLLSQLRRAEGERRASFELLETIVDNLPALISVRDAEARNLFVNRATRETYGMPEEELLGRTSAEVLHTVLGTEITEIDQRILASGDSMPFQEMGTDGLERFELVDPFDRSGRPRSFLVTKQVLDGEGPARLLTIAFDITELKLAQSAHQRSEAKLRSVLENIEGWVLTVNDQGTIFFANRPFPDTDFREMVASPLVRWLLPDSRPLFEEALARAGSGDGPQALEVRAEWPGTPWLDCRVSPVGGEGTVRELTISLLDIDGRRRAQDERGRLREQMRRLEKLDSLGALAGGIAHDFNNLLTAVLGNAAMAGGDVEEGSKAHRCLRRIEGAAERAAELCQQMLDFAGRAKTEPVPFDLSELVHDMVEALRGALSRSVVLDLELGEDLPPVHCDPTQIRRVVMNLITNANDALDGQSGTLRVVTTSRPFLRHELEAAQQAHRLGAGDYVTLEVHDDGCGMNPQTLEQIFDPFFTTKFSGRGLGLAAVGGTMRQHGGGIRVDSTPGHGTTFTLLFPAWDEAIPDAATEEAIEPEAAGGGGLVLVADDQEVVTELAKSSLEDAGYAVVVARDGAAALRLLSELDGELAAAVLDHGMPKANGLEVIVQARQQGSRVPFMLSSGFDESQLADELDDAPWTHFLRKPYRPDDLVRAVRRMLDAYDDKMTRC